MTAPAEKLAQALEWIVQKHDEGQLLDGRVIADARQAVAEYRAQPSGATVTLWTDRQITAAARVLAERNADACGVDAEVTWRCYSDDLKADALAALTAAVSQQNEEAK